MARYRVELENFHIPGSLARSLIFALDYLMNVMAKRNDRFRADIRWYTHVKYIVYIYIYIFNVILYIYIYLHTYMIYGTWYYAHSFSTDYRNDKTHFEGTRSRYTDTYTHVCTYMHAKRGRTHTRQEKHTTLVRVSSGTQTSTRFIPLRSVLRVSVVSHEISFFFFFFFVRRREGVPWHRDPCLLLLTRD